MLGMVLFILAMLGCCILLSNLLMYGTWDGKAPHK